MSPARSWLAAFALLFAARSADAQLRGLVRDSVGGGPLAGAVVTAVDSADNTLARAISDGDGRFAVATRTVAARLRVARIGYRPLVVPVPASPAALIDVMMGHIAPLLDVIRVVAREVCPGSVERGAAFEIWEQARAGLLATIVTREAKPARVRILIYETHIAPDDSVVQFQAKAIRTGQTVRPFIASAAPVHFARVGYMAESKTLRAFNAPDADVLIDESFAATHCFRLQRPDETHIAQIGIAFSPIRGRDTTVDVSGVIWLDAVTPQLRSLDFAYTSLEPAATSAGSGGHIEFQTLPNGASFISRWNMRLAALAQVAPGSTSPRARRPSTRRADREDVFLQEIVDAGGRLLDGRWPDGAEWADSLAMVSGVVAAKGTGVPVANALVAILGTPDTVRTDSAGRFRIETLPGRHVIAAADTAFSDVLPPRSQSMPLDLRHRNQSLHFDVASVERVLDDLCRGARGPGTGLIVGTVTFDPDARRGAELVVRFEDLSTAYRAVASQRIALDTRGRFIVCRLPFNQSIRLTLEASNTALADTAVIVPKDERAKSVVWRVRSP